MHNERKIDGRILTEARRCIDANRGHGSELPDPERDRRVAIYAAQVAATGHIITWLPPSQPRMPSRRTRFTDGDALGRRHAG